MCTWVGRYAGRKKERNKEKLYSIIFSFQSHTPLYSRGGSTEHASEDADKPLRFIPVVAVGAGTAVAVTDVLNEASSNI